MIAAKEQLHVRQAFGKPLVEQQYLQYKMAELATQLVTSRVVVRHAAAAIDNKVSFLFVFVYIKKLLKKIENLKIIKQLALRKIWIT